MTIAVFLQVIMRFLGRSPIDGIDEIPRYLFVWLVMIGAASAMYRREHTVLEYFVELLGPRGGRRHRSSPKSSASSLPLADQGRASFWYRTLSSRPAPGSNCRSGMSSPRFQSGRR